MVYLRTRIEFGSIYWEFYIFLGLSSEVGEWVFVSGLRVLAMLDQMVDGMGL